MTFKTKNRDTSFEGSYPNESTTDEKERLSGDVDDKSDFRVFMYNSKTRELFGRTLSNWFVVVGYSICFTVGVAAIWGLFLWVFYQTLDNYTPKLQQGSSFIGAYLTTKPCLISTYLSIFIQEPIQALVSDQCDKIKIHIRP